MSTQNLAVASAAYLASLRREIGVAGFGIEVTAPPYNAPTDGVTDATTAIQAAATDARAANLPLIFPPGSYAYADTLELDWQYGWILGHYATLVPSTGIGTAIHIGKTGGPTQQVLVSGLTIQGSANFAHNQTLIGCEAAGGKMINLDRVRLNYGKISLATTYTDYLRLENVFFKGSQTNWYAGQNTNVSTAIACAFSGQNNLGASVTDKQIHCDGVDGLVLIGCEFGDGQYGLYAPSGGNDNRGVTLINHRNERVVVADIVWGTGASGPPVRLTVENCNFMAAAGETGRPIILVNGGLRASFRNSEGTQTSASHVLVKAQNAGAQIHVEDCACYLGDIFEDSTGAANNSREILHGWP